MSLDPRLLCYHPHSTTTDKCVRSATSAHLSTLSVIHTVCRFLSLIRFATSSLCLLCPFLMFCHLWHFYAFAIPFPLLLLLLLSPPLIASRHSTNVEMASLALPLFTIILDKYLFCHHKYQRPPVSFIKLFYDPYFGYFTFPKPNFVLAAAATRVPICRLSKQWRR